MIDGLFGSAAAPFGMPPPGDLESIRNARAPFDAVDVVAATHYHPDHFDPAAVVDYLRASLRTRFVSTPQAVTRVIDAGGASLSDRVYAVPPVEGERASTEANGIRLETFGLSHGKANYAGVEHVGVVARFGERSLIHLGDGIIDRKALSAAGVLDEIFDVAILPFWYLTYAFGKRLITDGFRARAMFAAHIPVTGRRKIVLKIQSWSEATPLLDPLSNYQIEAGGRVIREE